MGREDDAAGPFTRFGPALPALPIVVAVPHGGRDYPPALIDASQLAPAVLAALEDRFVDRLAEGLPAIGVTGFVARRPRAWIDLNRDEREMDAAMVAPPHGPGRYMASAKVRGGLGLIPRRVAGAGDIYAGRLTEADVTARLDSDHRPWHAAVAAALAAARARFGVALLIDLHSMPPLGPVTGGRTPRIVVGDRHGRSASPLLVERLEAIARAAGLPVALNAPYSGGHTLERHGRPLAGIHAVQIEIDRTLYLAPDLRTPGDGLAATTAFVTHLVQAMIALLDDTRFEPPTLAAE